MTARAEFQKIVFGHMEDEEPTDRTKRAREVPENRVGKEVPPKRMRKLFADLKEAVRKSGKVKLSAREQLNIIRFGGEQIAKLVSSIERRATLNPKMAGPADKFLRDVAQNPMHLPTKRIYSNATPQDTASAIDRIAGSKKPSSEYTDQPYHRRALARAVKDWRGGGYENPALMKKWDWETKPPGARFSAREQLDTILFDRGEYAAAMFLDKVPGKLLGQAFPRGSERAERLAMALRKKREIRKVESTVRGIPGRIIDRGMGANIQQLSARDELNTILFSIFSTSTAKKVFRGLRGGMERAPLIRPSGPTALGAYLSKSATGEQASMVGDQIGSMIGSKVTMKPHSILLPRQNRFDLENSPIGKSGEKLPNIGGPVETAAHERGHAYDPNLPERMERMQKTSKGFMDALGRGDQAAAVSAGRSMGARTIQNEYVANKRVLDQVVQHGTAGEVSAWKKTANNQMKVGYRKPMFDAAIQKKNAPQYREIGETGETYLSPATNPTLSQGKQILRDNPYLRRSATALASRSGSLFLNAKGNSRSELDTILFANDPRPRDNQGQFTDANGNMINPNSIAIAYQKPQQQPQQQPQQRDKPKEEESKAKKLISKLNNKESNKKQTNMKQNNMSAREELNTILFGQPAPRSVKYLRHVLDGLGNEGKKEMAQASSMRAAMLMNKGEYLREIGGTGDPLRSMADTRNNVASGIRAIREHMRPRGGILYRGGVMPSSLQ